METDNEKKINKICFHNSKHYEDNVLGKCDSYTAENDWVKGWSSTTGVL